MVFTAAKGMILRFRQIRDYYFDKMTPAVNSRGCAKAGSQIQGVNGLA